MWTVLQPRTPSSSTMPRVVCVSSSAPGAFSAKQQNYAYTRRCLLALQAALPYHGDARGEFRFDGLRDPDTPVGQPSKSR